MTDTVIEIQEMRVTVTGEETADVISVGVQGPQGPQGASGDANFVQDFVSAATVVVVHNLAKFPSVTVFDSAHDEVEGAVKHDSVNQLTIVFSAPFSGKVICN